MIVSLYEGERYLSRIIKMFHENVRNFKRKNRRLETELILVNDYPNEEIVLSHIGLENLNIHIIQNAKNMGIQRSKIEGLKAAQGEYVFFLDQDDLISPYYFVEQYELIGECDAVICNVDMGEGPYYSKQRVEALDLNKYLEAHNAISSLGQVLFRKECIPQEWTECPLSVNGADDYYLIFIMLLKKQRMVEHRKVLYYHVHTGSNFSADFKKMCLSVMEIFRNILQMGLISQEQADAAVKIRQREIEEFIKAEKKYPGDARQERQDNIKLINLYDRCLKNLEANYKLDSYIKTFQCRHIAVYGAGKMGRHFIYWMRDTDTQIELLIDKRKKGKIAEIPIVDLGEAQRRKKTFEIIIVTPMIETEKIINDLGKLFVCPIISLESAIYNMPCELLKLAHETETERYMVN